MSNKTWEILESRTVDKLSSEKIVELLLKNRGIKTKALREEFVNPKHPIKLTLSELDIDQKEVKKAIKRIKKAIDNKEEIIVFGDYDSDGVCATGILWEILHALGAKSLPFIPDRFTEGYGINSQSVANLKKQHPKLKLIITVDNGIVANKQITEIKKRGIDVIITDHHQVGKKLPSAHAIVHTTKVGGAGLAWVLAREIFKAFKITNWELKIERGLDLAAIGTIADVIPLIGANRSFVKYGLKVVNETQRQGLVEMFKEAAIDKKDIGTYQVGFIISPRINAMGRLDHAMDSLRLLCTKDVERARNLSQRVGSVNRERQKVVQEVVSHAQLAAKKNKWDGVITLGDESYHEGVIGLAAARLVEKHYRPTIIFSMGSEFSKASARSITGFNIIKAIRQLDGMIIEGGGHEMAAGFKIKTSQIEEFKAKLDEIAIPLLTPKLLARKLKIDLEVGFINLNWELQKSIKSFEPAGIGNPSPTFATKGVEVMESRAVGADAKHLKLTLRHGDKVLDSIAFSFGYLLPKLPQGAIIDIAYNLEENVWNGQKNLQLKARDINIEGN